MPNPMTEVEAIKKRLEAATAGPWRIRPQKYDDWGYIRSDSGAIVATARAGGGDTSEEALQQHRANATDPYGHNAEFIAHAPADIAYLLSELHASQEREARLTEVLKPFADAWRFASGDGRTAHLSGAQLGRLAAGELSGVHFHRASLALALPALRPPTPAITAEGLLALLRSDNADVYKSASGTWHITRRQGEISESAVRALLERELIRPTYTTCRDCFTAGRTIDMGATLRARKEKGDRSITVYVEGSP